MMRKNLFYKLRHFRRKNKKQTNIKIRVGAGKCDGQRTAPPESNKAKPYRQADDPQTLSAITAENFDPCQTVYLPPLDRAIITVTNSSDSVVSHGVYSLNKIEADVDAPAPALVVFSHSYYHLWCATVGGRPAPLLRANLAFQAVEISAGAHHLELDYHDPYFEAGALISILTLLASGLDLIPLRWKRSVFAV